MSIPIEIQEYVSPQVMRLDTGGDHYVFSVSGSVIVNLKGNHRDEVSGDLTIPIEVPKPEEIDPNAYFLVEAGVGLVTLNAAANEDQAMDAGWRVDSSMVPTGIFRVKAKVVVRKSDHWIYQVGYSATARGTFAGTPFN
jgi:hypothetical protein